MSARSIFRRLASDRRGATAVEFALLAPVFIAMLVGVMQVGWGYQNYSAMRSLAAETARYTMLNTSVSNADIGMTYTAKAAASPYLLKNGTVVVTTATNQRFAGAREKTITVTAQVTSLFAAMGITGPQMTYSQPVFVPTT